MQLMWIQYTSNGNDSKYYLVFPINSTEDKMSVLLSSNIDSEDVTKIRKNISELDKMSIGDRIIWFRTNIKSYKTAYRDFKKSMMKINNSFELKPL